jgi:trigger factor
MLKAERRRRKDAVLKVTTEERANRELLLNIEVEPAELEQAMRVAARKLAAKVTVPGFRRGKAPYNIVLTYFGREAVIDEALEPLTEEMYRKALDEVDVHPIGPARVEDV